MGGNTADILRLLASRFTLRSAACQRPQVLWGAGLVRPARYQARSAMGQSSRGCINCVLAGFSCTLSFFDCVGPCYRVTDEFSFALDENKTVIPILCGECTMPFRLRRLQNIDFRVEYETSLRTLVDTLCFGS